MQLVLIHYPTHKMLSSTCCCQRNRKIRKKSSIYMEENVQKQTQSIICMKNQTIVIISTIVTQISLQTAQQKSTKYQSVVPIYLNLLKCIFIVFLPFNIFVYIFTLGILSLAGPNLKVSNVTETKIHVEWTPVIYPDLVIEKYQV